VKDSATSFNHLPDALDTERLLLRRPAWGDGDALYAVYSDVSVVRWLSWPVYTDKNKLIADIAQYKDRWNDGVEYYWVIEHKKSSTVIGSIACGVNGADADIGFMIGADHQCQGYATEAAQALLDQLKLVDEISRVVALVAAGNEASMAVLKKIGMHYRGVASRFMVCPNISDEPRDALIYSLDC
jgi:RimJ/RimL family protein N-acetyltransferase